METSHLHGLWAGPDNTRLSNKQYSFRLPVHIAAKLAALCEIYPKKNRTQIVADLLTAALDDLEKNLPEGLGAAIDRVDSVMAVELGYQEGEVLYDLGGIRGQFHQAANRHYKEMEQELGNEKPEQLFPNYVVTESGINKK